jgi:uncharacterized protein YkwD
MLTSSRAICATGVAALTAMLVLTAPASATVLRRAGDRSDGHHAPSAVAARRSRHRRRHRGRAAGVCLSANTHAVSASVSVMRAAVLCLVNQQRTAHGLPPLRASAPLNHSAQAWSDEMVASGRFIHGADFARRIGNAGFNWAAVGENIATGFSTPRAVVRAWMADVDHCQNILDPSYRELGIGINRRPVAGAASGPATWTEDFGLGMFQSPAAHDWRPADGCPYR